MTKHGNQGKDFYEHQREIEGKKSWYNLLAPLWSKSLGENTSGDK